MSLLFPNIQFNQITRSDLITFAKEKNLIAGNILEPSIPASILAKALSEKISQLDLQGRKTKRETLQKLENNQDRPRGESRQNSSPITESSVLPVDSSKPDKFYLLSGFPKTAEEISAIGKLGLNVHFYFFIKPEGFAVSQTIPLFEEAIRNSEKNSSLRTFMSKVLVYDPLKYQGMEDLSKMEEIKLERNESVSTDQEITKLRSTKGLKKQHTKDAQKEEIKETPQTVDLRKIFISEIIKKIIEASQQYLKYLV